MAYDYGPLVTFDVKPAASFPDFPAVGATKAEFLTNEDVKLAWTKMYDYYGRELAVDATLYSDPAATHQVWQSLNGVGGLFTVGKLPAGYYWLKTRWNPASVSNAFAIPTPPAA